jgi:hypothetical protein
MMNHEAPAKLHVDGMSLIPDFNIYHVKGNIFGIDFSSLFTISVAYLKPLGRCLELEGYIG